MDTVDPDSIFSVDVLKQPLARIIVNHFWVAPLLSGLAYLYAYYYLYYYLNLYPTARPLSWIDLSFYPLFMLMGGLLKSFFNKQIRSTFLDLQQNGSMSREAFVALQKDLQGRLNSYFGDVLGVAGAFAIISFYAGAWNNLRQIWPTNPFVCVVVAIGVLIDVVLGYVIMIAVWKVIATAYSLQAAKKLRMERH